MNYVDLKDITNNLDNKRIPLNSSQRADKESEALYPYVGANNIMGYIDEYIFDEKILCVAEDGGSWGKLENCAKIYNEKVWVNNHAHVLTSKDNLILEYLCYYLNFTDLNLHINGATRGKLTKSSLNSIQIPLPPLATQKKIAAILDAADDYRQLTKKLIAHYETLIQSLFLDMFGDPVKNEKGWEKVELKKLCSFEKSSIKPEDIHLGVNYIALDSIEKETGNIIEVYQPALNDVKSNKFKFDNRYILYGKLRPYLNKVALPEFDGICSTDIIPILPFTSKTNRFFISQMMKGKWFVNYSNERVSGANLPRISPKEIENYNAINPPFNLQNQFSDRVQAIETQKAQAQASLVKAEELFSSLLQKAFSGRLV